MTQAETLLNSIAAYPSNATTVSTSPINDYLTIDAEGRFINVPDTEILFGVETDLNAERKYFQCPRIVGDNIDLTKLGLRIGYRNALGEDDGYIVNDVNPSGEYITFSWLLGGKLFKAKGPIHFAVCAVRVDANGHETCVWNTTLATGTVLEGLPVVNLSITEESTARNVLQQLLDMMEASKVTSVQAVTNEGAKQIANVEAAGSEQRILIESKGAETLATIPEDYTSTYNMSDEALRKKAKAIFLEETGEVISVSDSSDDHVRGLKVFGKTEQVSTKGYQLFDASKFPTNTIGGATVKNNGDGSLTITGSGEITATYSVVHIYTPEESVKLLKAGTVYLKTEQASAPYVVFGLYYTESGAAYTKIITNASTANTAMVLTEEDISKVVDGTLHVRTFVYGPQGYTITPTTLKPMIYFDGDGTWEPFSGGKPSPNPDYPQELKSIEDTTVTIYGKNMLDISKALGNNFTESNGTYTLTRNGESSRFSNSIPLCIPADTPFTFSVNILDYNKSSESLPLYFKGVSGKSYYGSAKRTITNTYDEDIVSMSFYLSSLEEIGAYITISDAQLELGKVMTEYEPYRGDQTIAIPQILSKIEVPENLHTTRRIICDEIDFKRGVYIQRIKRLVLNNSQYWWDYTGFALEGDAYCYVVTLDDCAIGLSTSICTHFTNKPFAWDYRYSGRYSDHVNLVNKYFVTDIASRTEFIAWLDEQEAKGDPVVLNYALATPIEIPLTADELNAFRALHTNYPNTVVMNDSGATMQLLYNADTKTYLDQNYVSKEAYDNLVDRVLALENKNI